MRPSSRAPDEMRPVALEPGVAKYAEGSCLARFGDTHVLCTATVEDRPPRFLRDTGAACPRPSRTGRPGSCAIPAAAG